MINSYFYSPFNRPRRNGETLYPECRCNKTLKHPYSQQVLWDYILKSILRFHSESRMWVESCDVVLVCTLSSKTNLSWQHIAWHEEFHLCQLPQWGQRWQRQGTLCPLMQFESQKLRSTDAVRKKIPRSSNSWLQRLFSAWALWLA